MANVINIEVVNMETGERRFFTEYLHLLGWWGARDGSDTARHIADAVTEAHRFGHSYIGACEFRAA